MAGSAKPWPTGPWALTRGLGSHPPGPCLRLRLVPTAFCNVPGGQALQGSSSAPSAPQVTLQRHPTKSTEKLYWPTTVSQPAQQQAVWLACWQL